MAYLLGDAMSGCGCGCKGRGGCGGSSSRTPPPSSVGESYIREEDDAPPALDGFGGAFGESFAEATEPVCPQDLPRRCRKPQPLTASACVMRSAHRGLGFLDALHHVQRPTAEPDLVLRMNRIAPTMDMVIHFHGYSLCGPRMELVRDKEPISGVDFCNPDQPSVLGRTRPTIGIVVRGRWIGDQPKVRHDAYSFRRIFEPLPSGSTPFVEMLGFALGQAARAGGLRAVQPGRCILTAHSGGGASLRTLLGQLRRVPPDEVHIFDGLYGDLGPDIQTWLRERMECDAAMLRALRMGAGAPLPNARSCALRVACHRGLAAPVTDDVYMRSCGGAMRVLHGPSTRAASEELARFLARQLRRFRDVAPTLCRFYRVEETSVGHSMIPRFHGWRLLRDAAADVPCAVRMPCVAPTTRPRDAVRSRTND